MGDEVLNAFKERIANDEKKYNQPKSESLQKSEPNKVIDESLINTESDFDMNPEPVRSGSPVEHEHQSRRPSARKSREAKSRGKSRSKSRSKSRGRSRSRSRADEV